jgi:hypothetical protein
MTAKQSNIIVVSVLGTAFFILVGLAVAFRSPPKEPKWKRNPAYAKDGTLQNRERAISTNEAKERSLAVPSTTPDSLDETENPANLMVRAERLIRGNRPADAAEIMNKLMRDFSNSHETGVVKGLVRLLRQEGATPYAGPVTSCTVSEANRLKEQLGNMEDIARNYPTTSREKRDALDNIFGHGTFSNPALNLEDLLNCLSRLEASRQKAVGR